jgi:hypothetical protein
MRFKGETVLSFCLMIIAGGIVLLARRWPLRSALFPIIIGSLVFFMAALNFYLNLFAKRESREETSSIDFKLTEDMAPEVVKARTQSIFLWILGFLVLILLTGFSLAIPVFFFLFLKLKGKEGWCASFGLSALAWGAFYGLFVWLLDIPFLEGWIQKGRPGPRAKDG